MKTKNNTTFPQIIEIPQPLTVHPGISPLLAEEMISAAEFIAANPERYNGNEPTFRINQCGCILAIVEKSMKVKEVRHIFPEHEVALSRIFREADEKQNAKSPAWAVQRIEHFLRTGE